jgi:hypothetical protein
LNPTGSAIFRGNVGATTPLASLIITGDTTISGASSVQTNGDQIYSNIMTLNNNLITTALTTGRIAFGDQTIPTSGVFGSGFDLSAVTNNAANGPTGAGITGIVRVANFTVGGPGGANLSFNYPAAESFVGGITGGASQAIANTSKPTSIPGVVIYCVNGTCSFPPVPPTPTPIPTPTPPTPNMTPNNIPPTQEFYVPINASCDESGCDNLEVITGPNNCAYSNVDIEDHYQNPLIHRAILKQEAQCQCNSNNPWAKYCKANVTHVMNSAQHKVSVAHVAPAKKQTELNNLDNTHSATDLNNMDHKNKSISRFDFDWKRFLNTKQSLYFR